MNDKDDTNQNHNPESRLEPLPTECTKGTHDKRSSDTPLQSPPPDVTGTEGSKDSPLTSRISPNPPDPAHGIPVHKCIVLLPSWWDGIEETAELIFKGFAKLESMFLQDRNVVELARDHEGGYCLSPVSSSSLRSRVETLGRPHARRAGDKGGGVSLRPALCTEDQAKGLLASRAAQRHLPRINVVVSCPIAVKGDGNTLHILKKGFNRAHGVLITHGHDIPDLPLEEATEALANLASDFSFISKSDCARMMASFISPSFALGGLLKGGRVPITLTVADDSQAGKTFHQKMIAAIYGETPYVIAQKKAGVGGLDESFGHALYAGKPFIQIDNLRGSVDSQYIESFMTAEVFTARIPHRQEVAVKTSRFTVLASSNNLRPTKDLINRCSLVRIAKQPQEYPFHRFPEGDVLAHIMEKQSYYVGCIYAIVRSWVSQGCPRTEETRHPFRQWAQTLDWIVQDRWPQLGPLLENYGRSVENYLEGHLDDESDHADSDSFGMMS